MSATAGSLIGCLQPTHLRPETPCSTNPFTDIYTADTSSETRSCCSRVIFSMQKACVWTSLSFVRCPSFVVRTLLTRNGCLSCRSAGSAAGYANHSSVAKAMQDSKLCLLTMFLHANGLFALQTASLLLICAHKFFTSSQPKSLHFTSLRVSF